MYDYVPRRIVGESKVVVRSEVPVLDQDSYRDTGGADSTDVENADDVFRRQDSGLRDRTEEIIPMPMPRFDDIVLYLVRWIS